MKKILVFALSICAFINDTNAQLGATKETFTHADTLRGSLNSNRTWWDVLRYDIEVKPDYNAKTIIGKTSIQFIAHRAGNQTMQIDLQKPLLIDSIIYNKESIQFTKADTNVWYAYLKNIHKPSPAKTKGFTVLEVFKLPTDSITIYYHGKPREAIRPPWDGGWIWKKDAQGRPWMSVACQGLGASVWYPCKDHQSDEPDNGASLSVIVPDTLVAVGNGHLKSKTVNNGLATYTWEVANPINNYNIIPYIGKYVNFTDTLMGEKGKLDLSYWVLDYNLDKAKKEFQQAKLMLRAFEYWFGPYPFYEDGYKLVDAPHLGMEHQSAIAYGNGYQNGYHGIDLSGSGWGLKWDFIIVHESGHEWFANSITTKDIADMWVHEGFTNYSETLFTEYYYGKEAGNDYNYGIRKSIVNKNPIISHYGVNKESATTDMYYKGSNMLHTIRHAIDNDSLFRQILHGLNKTFYHQTVTTKQVEDYISKESKTDFSKVFDQYLRNTQIPELEYYYTKDNKYLCYRWDSCIAGFNLRLAVHKDDKKLLLAPTTQWKKLTLNDDNKNLFDTAYINRNFYIRLQQVEAKN